MIALHALLTLASLCVVFTRWAGAARPRCARSHVTHLGRFVCIVGSVYELIRIGYGGSVEPWQVASSGAVLGYLILTGLDEYTPEKRNERNARADKWWRE